MQWLPVCDVHRARSPQEKAKELAEEFRRLAEIKGEPTDDRFYIGMAQGFRFAWEQAAQMVEERLNG
jgi:hypothetical protein